MGKLWFAHPAAKWEEGLPVGNGRLGAMILGGRERERIALNQDSIWYGGPVDRVNSDARAHLEQVRRLLLAGRIPEAEELLRLSFSGTPQSQRPYQPLGDLTLSYRVPEEDGQGTDPVKEEETDRAGEDSGYRRELDLEQGIVTEQYRMAGKQVRKEYLASCPHGVIAVRIRIPEGTISLEAMLSRKRFYDHAGRLWENAIFMDGTLGEGGVSWMAAVCARVHGGTVRVLGEHLVIRDAYEIELFIGCETSFYEKDYRQVLENRLQAALRDGFETIRQAHEEDYRALYGRVFLRIGEEAEDMPLEERFARGRKEGFDGGFAALYFQYGRYLLIASSRPGSLPANLQGIWNEAMEPAWDSKFTININTEMNYWPAESCALSECHLPLFAHLLRMWENGKRTARKMYGCRGFVAHHNTDLWGDCAPQDIYVPATYWVMGAAWLCTHIWIHYLYTGDRAFLQSMYPILEDAVLFFHDFLIEVGGRPVTCPSVSPENTYILPDGTRGHVGVGVSMDDQILRDLLEGYLKASKVLQKEDTPLAAQSRSLLERLGRPQIGKYGQIMEWREDYEEEEPGHRHISQLYALHPSHQIAPDRTPGLAQAARKTLERRLSFGGGHTGWSCAWIVNFYARLQDGDKALENLEKLWKDSTFYNLMDNHPLGKGHVFQIDGNFGATAAIAEMLLQSDEERTLLLPALPKRWPEGSVRGLTAVGGVTVDLAWSDGRLAACSVYAPRETEILFRYEKRETFCRLKEKERRRIFED